MRRTRFLIWKEMIELGRDPRLLFIVIVAPILQLFLLAYAASTDIREVPVLIVDADRSAASRDVVARFAAAPTFTITDVVASPSQIDEYLDYGRAWLAVSIPRGFGDGLHRAAPQTIQIVADGSDANSAGVAVGYAGNLLAQYGVRLTSRQAGRSAPLIEPRIRVWFNP